MFLLESAAFEKIYGGDNSREIRELVEVPEPPCTRETVAKKPELLSRVDVIFSGWGAPRMDAKFLKAASKLKAVFYGAGSVRGFVTDELWDRGIRVTSAWAANAVPVTEYTLATVLFSLKHGWQFARLTRQLLTFPERTPVPGAYGSTVGIISLGMIGRMVCERLRTFDLHVIAYDPFVGPDKAAALGVEMVGTLDELFTRSDVVSLHTPALSETAGMIRGQHFRLMKPGATFVNTARGAVVNEREMGECLRERQDIQAVIDVTWPEPPEADSPLYTLPNVVLTPHIAGSLSNECLRLGRYVIEDLKRYLRGEPLKWEVTREKAALMA